LRFIAASAIVSLILMMFIEGRIAKILSATIIFITAIITVFYEWPKPINETTFFV